MSNGTDMSKGKGFDSKNIAVTLEKIRVLYEDRNLAEIKPLLDLVEKNLDQADENSLLLADYYRYKGKMEMYDRNFEASIELFNKSIQIRKKR